jgi:23S rRNA maturation mini-RNase III
MLSPYSVDNLTHAAEYLFNLVKSLNAELQTLQKLKDEVVSQQQQAHKQGQLVKKMTNYLSDELGRIELQDSNVSFDGNLKKLSETETKLRVLRGRLAEFVDSSDADDLKKSDSTIAKDLKNYELFLIELTTVLNQKIPHLEKIASRIRAETRESQQQKLLLKEMADLFNDELEELDSAFAELKGNFTVS